MPRSLSKPFFLLILLGSLLLFMGLFRVAFLVHFEGFSGLRDLDLWRSLYLGLKFDARLAAVLLMPVWLLLRGSSENSESSLPKDYKKTTITHFLLGIILGVYLAMVLVAMVDDRAARPWLGLFLALLAVNAAFFRKQGLWENRWIWGIYAAVTCSVLLTAYFVDFGAYSYIHTRLNGSLLMFLDNAGISLQMIWQSYPVGWLVLANILLTSTALWLLSRLARRLDPAPVKWIFPCPFSHPRTIYGLWEGFLVWSPRVLVTLSLLALMYGKVSRYPLRWGEAFEAKKGFYAQLALNPILFLLETRVDMEGGFDLEEVRRFHAVLAEYFRIPIQQDAQGLPNLQRTIQARPQVQGRPNVVLIQLESFAAYKTGILGNALNPTPFFDELARQSLFFDRFYVVMENTSRSMFASLFSLPDVSSVQNATRNPLLLDQDAPLRHLQGYEASFHLGGSASWAQIRGILRNNFKNLQLFEEGSFHSPVVDVWGICDADLLLETHEYIKSKQNPFWAYIQTSGNHPPFTLPRHHKAFEIQSHDLDKIKKNGFTGNQEYNAVRFMDYSLQVYFEAARTSPYFQNTVFVLWGDHGISRGATDQRFGDLLLANHHVPFLIYAPGFIQQGRRISTVCSQLDLMPTLMALLGHTFQTQALGQDILDPGLGPESAAFTFTTFRRPPRLGLIQGEYYLNLEPDGRPSLYHLQDQGARNLALEEPLRTRRMQLLSQAYYHWGKYLLSHNKPQDKPKTS